MLSGNLSSLAMASVSHDPVGVFWPWTGWFVRSLGGHVPYMTKSMLHTYPVKRLLTWYSYDVELPIECDDEYWEHADPAKCWKQPPGKPSTISYFNSILKLYDILGFALRTIVS